MYFIILHKFDVKESGSQATIQCLVRDPQLHPSRRQPLDLRIPPSSTGSETRVFPPRQVYSAVNNCQGIPGSLGFLMRYAKKYEIFRGQIF